MKKALVIYYSQSGQAKEIADTIIKPLSSDFEIVYEELKPIPSYPFPYIGMTFFQTFAESVQGIPCKLEPHAGASLVCKPLVLLTCALPIPLCQPSIPANG